MREIKFRGYDTDSKEWRYGSYFCKLKTTLSPLYNNEEQWKKDKEENEEHLIFFNGFSDWNMPVKHYQSEVDGKSIGQYIGVRDKNGKEIYEGDIVKRPSYTDYNNCYHVLELFGVVKFDNFAWCVIKKQDNRYFITPLFEECEFCDEKSIEVIGNIYENPELLSAME